jgi:imidazolonepropionase-like amidohydrolase
MQSVAETVVIRNAMIFDGTGVEAYPGSVLIKKGRIAQIGKRIKVPKNSEIIDANGMALLPGLIDIHTHWTPEGEPQAFPDIATSFIQHGVTTVDDFHAAPESYQPKREWLQTMITPHVNYAARISTPGGHGAVWGDKNTTRRVSTPADARLTIKQLSPFQPDIIKIFADGWRYGYPVENTSMNEDAMTELATAAHENDFPVMAHIVTVARAKIAARAGVDVIVHALQNAMADDELIELMKKNDVIYSPSLAVYEPKPEKLVGLTTEKLARVQRRQAFSLYNLRVFRDAGIRIAVGSDSGMEATPHGESTLRELELLVAGGLTASEALVAATLHSAQAVGMDDDRGTVEIGKRADLILVNGNPWNNIEEIRNINTVFVDGRITAQGGLLIAQQPDAVPDARKAERLIDDFENANGRSGVDTQRLDNSDSGTGRTMSLSQRILRADDDHALSLAAVMAVKKDPEASVIIPFTRGAVVPVDGSTFSGVRFDIRGDGEYFLRLNTSVGLWTAPINANAQWQTVSLPFAKLKSPESSSSWSGKQLLSIEFGGSRKAAESLWMELDNVQFY